MKTKRDSKYKYNKKAKGGNFVIYFVSFWRHGRAVRRGTANPFSPVQIRVSPDQQKNRNTLFCFSDITCQIFFPAEASAGQGLLRLA